MLTTKLSDEAHVNAPIFLSVDRTYYHHTKKHKDDYVSEKYTWITSQAQDVKVPQNQRVYLKGL